LAHHGSVAQLAAYLGGTFDPIHNGHLVTAEAVRRRLGVPVLHFLPAARPPHKRELAASARQRLRMVELAIRGNPGFALDDREFRRATPSYTIDTMLELRAELGDRPICLVLGMDSFLQLPGWHRWDELLDLCHFAVMQRPGWEWPDSAPRWCADRRADDVSALTGQAGGRYLVIAVPRVDVSATTLRERIAAGEDVGAWLPAAVWNFIKENELYGHQAR
jgi:nicotinate-nucleotide adenylyltransferase